MLDFPDLNPEDIIKDVAWRSDPITMFGKTYPQPRLTAWYGDPGVVYTYSKITMETSPWTPLLFKLKEQLNLELEAKFNSVLLNYYRDGNDHMSYHADDEKELGPNPTIASLSLGATRSFHVQHRYKKDKPTFIFDLKPGSLLVMKGEFQHFWVHKIAKTKKSVEGRLNLTFRRIL